MDNLHTELLVCEAYGGAVLLQVVLAVFLVDPRHTSSRTQPCPVERVSVWTVFLTGRCSSVPLRMQNTSSISWWRGESQPHPQPDASKACLRSFLLLRQRHVWDHHAEAGRFPFRPVAGLRHVRCGDSEQTRESLLTMSYSWAGSNHAAPICHVDGLAQSGRTPFFFSDQDRIFSSVPAW